LNQGSIARMVRTRSSITIPSLPVRRSSICPPLNPSTPIRDANNYRDRQNEKIARRKGDEKVDRISKIKRVQTIRSRSRCGRAPLPHPPKRRDLSVDMGNGMGNINRVAIKQKDKTYSEGNIVRDGGECETVITGRMIHKSSRRSSHIPRPYKISIDEDVLSLPDPPTPGKKTDRIRIATDNARRRRSSRILHTPLRNQCNGSVEVLKEVTNIPPLHKTLKSEEGTKHKINHLASEKVGKDAKRGDNRVVEVASLVMLDTDHTVHNLYPDGYVQQVNNDENVNRTPSTKDRLICFDDHKPSGNWQRRGRISMHIPSPRLGDAVNINRERQSYHHLQNNPTNGSNEKIRSKRSLMSLILPGEMDSRSKKSRRSLVIPREMHLEEKQEFTKNGEREESDIFFRGLKSYRDNNKANLKKNIIGSGNSALTAIDQSYTSTGNVIVSNSNKKKQSKVEWALSPMRKSVRHFCIMPLAKHYRSSSARNIEKSCGYPLLSFSEKLKWDKEKEMRLSSATEQNVGKHSLQASKYNSLEDEKVKVVSDNTEETVAIPVIMTNDIKREIYTKLAPVFERMELKRNEEEQSVKVATGCCVKKGKSGRFKYCNIKTGEDISPKEYQCRYLEMLKKRKEKRRSQQNDFHMSSTTETEKTNENDKKDKSDKRDSIVMKIRKISTRDEMEEDLEIAAAKQIFFETIDAALDSYSKKICSIQLKQIKDGRKN